VRTKASKAPRGGGMCGVGMGVLFPTGEGSGTRAVLPLQKMFSNLDIQIDFWCIVGIVFSQFSCLFYHEADEFSLLKFTISTAEDIIW